MRAIKFGTMMATLAATDQRGDRFILDTCQALAAQRCLSRGTDEVTGPCALTQTPINSWRILALRGIRRSPDASAPCPVGWIASTASPGATIYSR